MVATYVSSLLKGIKEFKGTAMNTSIAAFTILLEEILNRTVYYCPCVDPTEITCQFPTSSDSVNSTYKCTLYMNRVYGISFLVAPAIALFFFMAASSPKLWKTWTGSCKKNEETRRAGCLVTWTLSEIFGRALIAPITWVCFALLDGRYYACAVTPLPYDVGIGGLYDSCNKVAKSSTTPFFSDAFSDNRSFSQLFGWASIAGSVLLGFIVYAFSRCVYPLTYYHAKYYSIYQGFEESEFDDEMKIKAQKDAESNIRKFMSKNRSKELWDRISTVFSYHRDPKNKALYSYLHEFIIEEESNQVQPLLVLTSGANDEADIENGEDSKKEDTSV